MIFRNAPMAKTIAWTRDANPLAADIARRFLFGEAELLDLNRGDVLAIAEIQSFLYLSADSYVTCERSKSGDLLLRASGTDDTVMITGRTAQVLRAYIDHEPVCMEDRLEMTQRRRITQEERSDPGRVL